MILRIAAALLEQNRSGPLFPSNPGPTHPFGCVTSSQFGNLNNESHSHDPLSLCDLCDPCGQCPTTIVKNRQTRSAGRVKRLVSARFFSSKTVMTTKRPLFGFFVLLAVDFVFYPCLVFLLYGLVWVISLLRLLAYGPHSPFPIL